MIKSIVNIEQNKIEFDWAVGLKAPVAAEVSPIDKNTTIDFVRDFLDSKSPSFSKRHSKRITYIDLFCGGGGLSLGVHHALHKFGYDAKLLVAADKDQNAMKIVKHHFKPMINSDAPIEDWLRYSVDLSGQEPSFLSFPEINDPQIKQFKGKVDLLVGGPPCQGHSNLNNKTRRFDPRNLLYFTMPAMAVCLDIPVVIIENVKSIKRASENVTEITKNIFQRYGYKVAEVVLDGLKCGVAQTRSRHFMVASKHNILDLELVLDQLSTQHLSFDDVNRDLPELSFASGFLESAPNLSIENKERIEYLHFSNERNLKNELRPVCHQEGHSYPSVYGRLEGDKPSGTITTGFASPGRGRFIHPHEPRMITIREAARLQSFPDWYFEPAEKLGMNRANLQKIIGDAVPSLMVFPLIAATLSSLGQ